jgi:vacuolar-type H+-ATPase subunit E/Vma4
METVKSSEALESQILEDARAKARRLLEHADRECAAIRADWERKDAEELGRMEAAARARAQAMRQELASSLPLENMRSRLSHIQDAVTAALKALFDSLSGADLAAVIGGQLSRVAGPFAGEKVTVWTAGITADDARRLLAQSMPSTVVADVKPLSEDAARESGKGVVIESVNGAKRYRGTLAEVSAMLLEEHREELVTALFGKDVQA